MCGVVDNDVVDVIVVMKMTVVMIEDNVADVKVIVVYDDDNYVVDVDVVVVRDVMVL